MLSMFNMYRLQCFISFQVIFCFSRVLTAQGCYEDKDFDQNFYDVEFVGNFDGDTITVNIPNIHPFFARKMSIRINGIDTAELHTGNKAGCERQVAVLAKEYLNYLLSNSNQIDLLNVEKGK